MNERNLFEVAARGKMRFPYRGVVSVEDLYDLSVTQLDTIFKTLNKESKQMEEESLLGVKTQQSQELQDQISIIKYIVGTKQEENALKLKAREKTEKKQKLLQILASKQEEAMQNKTEEEILAELEALEN